MSTEKELSDINFFICSTYEDLKVYRDTVIKFLQSKSGIISAQEFFGSRDKKPLETCLEEVDRSNVFIMFLGPRFGTTNPDSIKSIVECEYERAKGRKIPIFCYLIDESHSFPIKYVSIGKDAEKLIDFKNKIQKDYTVSYFTTPEDLAKKVYADLIRELPKSGFKIGIEKEQDKVLSTISVLSEFLILPKMFHGREIKIKATLGGYKQASKKECEAFSYRHGAAVAREFTPEDKELKKILGVTLSHIYAEEEKAIELMEAPGNTFLNLRLKTLQGEYTTSTPIYGDKGGIDNVVISYVNGKVVIDYHDETNLLCGLEFIEILN